MSQPDNTLRRTLLARRVVYVLLAGAIILTALGKLQMKVVPAPLSRKVYERLEALPEGSPILFSFDYDPSAKEELYPMSQALLRHAFRRNLRPLVMTFWLNGVGLCKELVERTAKEAGKESGRDFVFLAYKPGGSNLLLNMGESLKGAFDKDFYGKPTEAMPALEGVDSLRDIPVVVGIAAGSTTEMWIAYGRDRFGFDLGAGCTAVIAPDLYPFLQSDQLFGLLGGLRGAADYEVLIGKPDTGVKGMPLQSVAHILIIVLIVAANVYVFAGRRSRRQGD
ncbi:MAG TPA: hypothetical protein PLE19_05065 [Planctomycetota bacterium]|nr:hypothetical protein [Planctomycetota bacterium]HRR79855.1 hypothetical protein [Planctomycetota bacterium]HRT92931.1 hypothetical protein [Planctomycetota bacterium]